MLQRTPSFTELGTKLTPAGRAGRELLTPRERQIVRLVAIGDSNKEIAQQLSITERTVKAHLTSIFEKLGCSSRLKLAVYAISREVSD